jgi:hypothetical protein
MLTFALQGVKNFFDGIGHVDAIHSIENQSLILLLLALKQQIKNRSKGSV